MAYTFCEKMETGEIAKLMHCPLESRDFNRVAQWLRGLESEARVSFLKEHFEHSSSYRLAISTINNRAEAFEILGFGLDAILSAHSQRTKFMAQFGITKLGAKRTIAEIASRIDTQPHVVDMGLYWMPSMIPKADPAWNSLMELQKKADELKIIRPTQHNIHSDGRVTFTDRYKD